MTSQPRRTKIAFRVQIAEPFDTAVKATLGVVVGLALVIWGMMLVFDVTGKTMSAADVRAVCAAHEGVQALADPDGGLLPSHLVLCRDGYVGEPKP